MRHLLFIACLLIAYGSSVYAGSIVAWGDNTYGQCDAPDGNDFVAIAAGGYHSLAIKGDGSLVGWGNDASGEISNIPAGNDFIAIAAGGLNPSGSYAGHCLALKSNGTVLAWGRNIGSVPAHNDYIAIAAGYLHNLGIRSDGSLVAWGDNTYGQLNVPSGNDFIAISCDGGSCLALKSDGSLIGWGFDSHGVITGIPSGNDFISISSGYFHRAALKSDGSIAAWGKYAASAPIGKGFISIGTGHSHSLAITKTGGLVSWGDNSYGQLDVPIGNSYSAIDGGVRHSIALIGSTGPKELVLYVPNGMERLVAGQIFDITWQSQGSINDVLLELSTDSGSNWAEITKVGNLGYYSWQVPSENSSQCFIRISDFSDPNVNDISDSTFSISHGILTLLSPNGNENLVSNKSYNITWQTSGAISDVLLEYSTNKGNNWIPITSVPNTGSYQWNVPAIYSRQCLFRVSDFNDASVYDESDSVFAIYNCQSDDIVVNQNGAGGYNDIQSAINASVNGDTVIVLPGTYNENINFIGREITLKSYDPDDISIVYNTVITADSGRSVTFNFGEDESSVIMGFSIRGKGILCESTSPVITNNIISGCIIDDTEESGAAILGKLNASPKITNNEIDSNMVRTLYSGNSFGGAIANCDGLIAYNKITSNLVSEKISCSDGVAGGGAFYKCNGMIVNNVITGNKAYLERNSCASGERGNGSACGAAFYACDGTIANNIISGNDSIISGGGEALGSAFYVCNGNIINNTIVYNDTKINSQNAEGSSLYNCNGIVKNNIIAFNIGGGISGISQNTYNNLWSNTPNHFSNGALAGVGDISVDPLFIDGYYLKSEIGRWNPASGLWVIDSETSQCIDAGDPDSDIGLEPNPNGGIINMGAYGGTFEASKSTSGISKPVCLNPPSMDTNNDCKIDLVDFAVFASEWLSCGLDIQSACW